MSHAGSHFGDNIDDNEVNQNIPPPIQPPRQQQPPPPLQQLRPPPPPQLIREEYQGENYYREPTMGELCAPNFRNQPWCIYEGPELEEIGGTPRRVGHHTSSAQVLGTPRRVGQHTSSAPTWHLPKPQTIRSRSGRL
ncbi:unnamed protein product [Rhodiola kirilowii]